jgi:hypothetical protein
MEVLVLPCLQEEWECKTWQDLLENFSEEEQPLD